MVFIVTYLICIIWPMCSKQSLPPMIIEIERHVNPTKCISKHLINNNNFLFGTK